MTNEGDLKKCFVIAPIGDKESETRERSDKVLKYIIKPVAEECGYKAVRADEITEPGMITSQVIQRLVDDDLVIADLTDSNPNVFYELAVRHAVRKPVVQIIKSDEYLPFDIAPQRTIPVDHQDLDSVEECKEEMIKQIRYIEENPNKVDSPVSVGMNLKSLQLSENPLEKSNAEILTMLQDIKVSFRQYFDKLLMEREKKQYDRDLQMRELEQELESTKNAYKEVLNFVRVIEKRIEEIEPEVSEEKLNDIKSLLRNFIEKRAPQIEWLIWGDRMSYWLK